MEGSSNLELQRKNCRVVIGLEGVVDGRVCRFVPNNFDFLKSLEMLASDGFRYFAILHDKDATEYKHVHLVLCSSRVLRLRQFLNACCEAFGCDAVNVSVRETTNINKNIQYLIHKNEGADKHKYDASEVMSNANPKDLLDLLNSDENIYDDLVSTQTLRDIVKRCENPTQLMDELGYKFINQYYRVVSIYVNELHPYWIENRMWR